MKTCCIIGNMEVGEEKLYFVTKRLREEIIKAIENGVTNFISSFEDVVDLLFADIIVELMENYPHITLEAAISHFEKLETTNIYFQKLLEKCKTVGITSQEYYEGCFLERNRLMIKFSKMVLFVYDGQDKETMLWAIEYANNLHKKVVVINI